MKLFCIPYSGGSADGYYQWKKLINPAIEICPIELAGHGRRIREPFFDTVDQAAADLARQIQEKAQPGETYALLGHSMGALLAFETYYHLAPEYRPAHIFFCGRKAPQDMDEPTEYYKLPEEEFLEVVYRYGGTTKEVLKNTALRSIFLPILRADFKLSELYIWNPKAEKITCPFTVVNGRQDYSAMIADMTRWQEHGQGRILTVEGSHFFLFEQPEALLHIIQTTLL